jgi:hypothetical protein
MIDDKASGNWDELLDKAAKDPAVVKVVEKEKKEHMKHLLESNGTIDGKCLLSPEAESYASGVYALRNAAKHPHPQFKKDDGSEIIRPFTFKENIEARVDDYNCLTNPDGSKRTEKERLRLFSSYLDSCTGIAHKRGSSRFKIIPVCKELILIDEGFDANFLSVDYDSLPGIELKRDAATYNHRLSKNKVLEHPAWKAAVGDDNLLKAYVDIIFGNPRNSELLGFCITRKTDCDELRALSLCDIDYGSYVRGQNDLNDYACFLQEIK